MKIKLISAISLVTAIFAIALPPFSQPSLTKSISLNEDVSNKNAFEPESTPNKAKNHKNNAIKQSSEQLIGTWTNSFIKDGKKLEQVFVYLPDGTFSSILVASDLSWQPLASGTWQFKDGILSVQFKDGKKAKASVNFVSDKELYSNNDNSSTKWQKSDPSSVSANQLIGTWGIINLQRTGRGFTPALSSKITLTGSRITFNANGTYLYEYKEGYLGGYAFEGGFVKTTRHAGTWEYQNLGYGDGFLFLKDSQGNTTHVSIIYKQTKGQFLNVNVNKRDPNNNTRYVRGKVEALVPRNSNN